MGESRKKSIIDNIPNMDKVKATKYIVRGITIALLFGIIMLTSASIAANADNWKNIADQENKMDYWDGDYGYNEYVEKSQDITQVTNWMVYQQVIIANIARVGVYIGFLFVFIGLMGFATNDRIDENTRKICLILAGVIIMGMLFTLMFNTAQIIIA